MPEDVKTGKAEGRRELVFESFDDVLADLDRLESAHAQGALRAIGNWRPGQVFDHLAKVIDASLDGFTFTAPLAIRLMSPLLRRRLLGTARPIPGGIRLRGGSVVMLPDDVSFEDGLAHLRRSIGRVTTGERMTQRSPVFGRMTHSDWVTLHLKHCALHMGFLIPG